MSKLYDVHDKTGHFQFRATLKNVGRLMNWQQAALARIVHETEADNAVGCAMFHPGAGLIAKVYRADDALGTEAED